MKNSKKLLAELGELSSKNVYFRTHNLLTSGDGTPALKWGSTGAYGEDGRGNPVYNWTIVDQIFEWENSPIRRVEALEVAYQSHRTMTTPLRARPDLIALDPPAEEEGDKGKAAVIWSETTVSTQLDSRTARS